jgi:hypothetical protein
MSLKKTHLPAVTVISIISLSDSPGHYQLVRDGLPISGSNNFILILNELSTLVKSLNGFVIRLEFKVIVERF